MGDKRNYAALDWVIGEIGETLKDARQSLEAYVEDPRDTARIRFCLTHIHQVNGSLQMVEFHGASLFAEEMELLATAIMNGQVINEHEAQEALMRSLLQLPLYLEQVKTLHEDHPGTVLPLLNDIRAVRKESYLSETNLFNPDLSSIGQIRGERHIILQEQAKLKQVIHKLREMFQYAAASVLRGVKIDENLAYLEKVFNRLEGITRGTACHPLWQASAALAEALARDDVELSIAVRGLLRYLARELKILEEHCPAALDAPVRESLLRNLLFYIARAEGNGPRVAQVKRQYRLDKALLGGTSARLMGKGMVSPPEPDAIRAVVVALQDELNTCKHLLDLALSGQGGMSDLEEMLPYVKRISDTLAVLGIGELRKQTLAQFDALALICQTGDYSDGALIEVATGLANIEHRLEAIGKGAAKNQDYANVDEREVEVNSAKDALLAQCRGGLETVKNAIVESMAGRWEPSHLPAAVETLHFVYGGLNMLPLTRPAAVLETCGEFIREHLLQAQETPTEQLQTLAEAIASIDYFLERLEGGHGDDLDIYLDMAEASLAQLGYSVNHAGVADDEADADTDGAAYASTEDFHAQPLEPSIDFAEADASNSSELGAVAEVEPEPLAAPTMDELNESHELPSADEPEPQQEDEGGEIDQEIVEIFIEEANEVLQTLAEAMPKWRDSRSDQHALGVIRRAFHTLKGSGRMVEAYAVGELAWSVESMLNRVLDGAVAPESAHVQLVDQVLELVPELIEAFAAGKPAPHAEARAQYSAWAQQLAAGDVPGGMSSTGSFRDFSVDDVEAHAPVQAIVAEDDGDDYALWEIFASEANTHLQVVDEFVEQMDTAAPLYSAPTDDLQRALHTLKGSAHMAAVTPIAAMITPLESFIKELRSYQLRIDEDILQLLKDASTYTREGLAYIEQQQPVILPKLEQFIARVDELYDRYIAPLIHMREQGSGSESHKVDPTLLTAFMSDDMSLLLEADRLVRQWQAEGQHDPEALVELYSELRELDTVAEQANLNELQQLADLLSQVYAGIDSGSVSLSERAYECLAYAHETLLDMFDQVAAAMTVQPASTELQQQLRELLAEQPAAGAVTGEPKVTQEGGGTEPSAFAEGAFAYDADTVEGADEHSSAGFDLATDFVGEGFSEDEIEAAHREAHVSYQAPEAEPPSGEPEPDPVSPDAAVDVAEADDTFAEQDTAASEHESIVNDAWALQDEHAESTGAAPELDSEPTAAASQGENSGERTDAVVEQDETFAEQDSFVSAQMSADEPFDYLQINRAEAIPTEDSADEAVESEQDVDPGQHHAEREHEQAATTAFVYPVEHGAGADAPTPPLSEHSSEHSAGHIEEDDFDPDILEIFLEEAGELIEELDEAIHAWDSNRDDQDAAETMKRALHTLKGGARLSGLKNLGELTHDYESYLIATGGPQADANFFPTIHTYQDRVLSAVRDVRARLDGDRPSTQQDSPRAEAAQQTTPAKLHKPASAQIVHFARTVDSPEVDEEGGFVTPAPKPKTAVAAATNKRQGSQEMIKVSADLLEELVNLAGETSISRGRLEQQVSDLSSAVDEVDGTLRRLNEQLRRLDLETDAQVSFRQEQMAAHEGFDPLEMDRYSQLQQLTRSLMESASDLGDLKVTLSDKIRDTETLLLQQSRINSALQEGLMRSRMVPFSRLVPRLRRIVRQVSGELGKHVSFELDNVEGEMDRSVLERMVAPLEHMLRNAVDHGIEMPHERVQDGKPETGRILLSLAREGGDILLRMADDGRGIHLDRVREKAIERGLMTADAELSDHDVMQFILQAGFSTAENVTQISGRGVGMDVVAAEIKQLGGSIVIDSRTGVGTQFTVRLPFTVSVNRALMVQLGTDTYAIPLNTIEGIVRVSPFELEHYYTHPDARFEYAGENYQVRHLGSMLSHDLQPKLDGQVLPLPVILVRSAQHTMALQVDGLMGSREIVVKSLGPQFAAVQGLSGATVMGDGSVVVIIDPHALVRREVAQSALPAPVKTLRAPVESAPELKTIMVVDDSVTVRKVTGRFLEREGYDVITAKDGVDALQLLQEEVPDLMLLDIEMPRMDGFEVAKNIRSTRRLKHLPIIMITSRTGDKHRQHALSIGVNEYMGKPYQEEALLKAMQTLLAKPRGGA